MIKNKNIFIVTLVLLTLVFSFNTAQGAWFTFKAKVKLGSINIFSPQKYQTIDDWLCSGATSCAGTPTKVEYTGEEAIWSSVAGSPFNAGFSTSSVPLAFSLYGTNVYLASGQVKQDTETGLWWSDIMVIVPVATAVATSTTNQFTLVGQSNPPGTGGYGDGTRPNTGTGNAVSFCDALNSIRFGGYVDWYLPTQKQLMQAYIDGSANNLPNPGYSFWSSTEYYNNTAFAWYVFLNYGNTDLLTKTTSYYVRCVRS